MYNTCFWALVDQAGMTAQEANKELSVGPSCAPSRAVLTRLYIVTGHHLEPEAGAPVLSIWHQLQSPTADVPQGFGARLGG